MWEKRSIVLDQHWDFPLSLSSLGFPPPFLKFVCLHLSKGREGFSQMKGGSGVLRKDGRKRVRMAASAFSPLPKKGELKRFSTIFFPPVLTFGGSAGVKSHLTLSTPSSSNASTFAPFGTRHH